MLASRWMTRAALFRLMALLLLLVTGAEVFACEMIEPEQCESFESPGSTGGAPSGDNCICCCTHVVVIAPFALAPVSEGVTEVTPIGHPKPKYQSFSIYHPPKV